MIAITDQELDPEAISACVRKDSNGAVVTFLGFFEPVEMLLQFFRREERRTVNPL